MALTAYTQPSTTLTPTYVDLPVYNGTYTITAMAASGTTDILVTYSTNHNFKVGQTISFSAALVATGSYNLANSTVTIKTVPAANQITFYAAASLTGSWTSGGTSTGYTNPNQNDNTPSYTTSTTGMAKFVNNKYFWSDGYGNLFYSSDGINWTWTVPTHPYVPAASSTWNPGIMDIDYDGTVYAVCDTAGTISYSSDLNTWTTGLTGSGTPFYAIKWCGGSYNAWVAIGGTSGTPISYTAPSGGATWTSRTSGATTALKSLDFDGITTVVAVGCTYSASYTGTVVQSTAPATWTALSTSVYGATNSWSSVLYNPVSSLWYIYAGLSASTATYVKTTAQLNTATTATDKTLITTTSTQSAASSNGFMPIARRPQIDKNTGYIYYPSADREYFIDGKCNATPVTWTDYQGYTRYRHNKLGSSMYSIFDTQTSSNPSTTNPYAYFVWTGSKWFIVQGNPTVGDQPTRIIILG